MTDVRFIDVLCDYKRQVTLLFMVSVLAIVVLSISMTVIEAGTATYVVTIIQLVSFGLVFVLSSALMVTCGRRSH